MEPYALFWSLMIVFLASACCARSRWAAISPMSWKAGPFLCYVLVDVPKASFTAFVVWMPANRWHGRNTRSRCCYSTCWAPSWSIRCSGCNSGCLQSATLCRGQPGLRFQHGHQFHHQHQLQGYSGESTMGYLVQMAGLAVQNFLSAATGICVAIAVIRGFARHSVQSIGNFLGRPHSSEPLRVAAAGSGSGTRAGQSGGDSELSRLQGTLPRSRSSPFRTRRPTRQVIPSRMPRAMPSPRPRQPKPRPCRWGRWPLKSN